jgi:ribosomal protein L29
MDKMPPDMLKLAASPRDLNPLPKAPAACPTHQPSVREEGQRLSFFEHVGDAAMASTLQAASPEYAISKPIVDGEAAIRALVEMVNLARESYFRHAPPAEREEHEESMRDTRAFLAAAGDRVDDVESELTELLNQARDSYFRNAPQAERDQHDQDMQQMRSMSNAEIVAYCNDRKAEYLHAPEAEPDQYEHELQQMRSMSHAEIVAYCIERKAEYLPKG